MLYRSTLFAVPVSFAIVWIGIWGSDAILSILGLGAGILIEMGLLPRTVSAEVKGIVIATTVFAAFGFLIGYLAVFGTSNLIRRANQTVVSIFLSSAGILLTLFSSGFALLMTGNFHDLIPDLAWLAGFLFAIAIAPRYRMPDVADKDADENFDPAKYTEPDA